MADVKSKRYTGVYYRILDNGSKTYYIIYRHPTENKNIRLKIGSDKDGFNEVYCYNKRAEILAKLRLGDDLKIPIVAKKQHKTTLNDIADKYFDSRAIAGETISLKERRSKFNRHLRDTIGYKPLVSIKKDDVIGLQKELISAGYANATIGNILQLGATIFYYAIKQGLYNFANPFISVEHKKTPNARIRYLSLDEVQKLKDSVKNDEILYLFVLISITTGARLEGVLNIRLKDIDFNAGIINIYDFKSGDRYAGFLTDEVRSILESKDKLKENDYIISYENGEKTEKKRIQRRLKPILDKLFNSGLVRSDRGNRVVIHTLRHTFASLLAIQGTPIYTIQRLLNHKDIKQTTRYAKLSPKSGADEVKRLFDKQILKG
ncbi:site-specific integrase [Campylobacter sp. RM16190]|uniref:tyrosine-type recombinase/integrase n=1 Tax=Campylobacter sp. RM16190 TaxID=1705727 RepID=UPI001473081C|nr:site-specific integrase [Campylobacter sp. RM16190]